MSDYGKATGPIRFHFIGDEPAARQRIGEGRAFLGQVKEFMRLSEIKSYQSEAILHNNDTDKDIGVVRAKSNNNGLAAIDEVWITVPKLPKEKKMQSKCIGYIIQFDTTSLASTVGRVPIVLTDPIGKVFNSWRYTSYRNVWNNKFGYLGTYADFAGFPAKPEGAEFFPLFDSSKEGANLSDNGIEAVYSAKKQGHDGEDELPFWTLPELSVGPLLGYAAQQLRQAENVGYIAVSSYKFDNGDIVLDVPVDAAIGGQSSTLFMMDFGDTKKFKFSEQIINGWYEATATSSIYFNPRVSDGWSMPITVREGVHKIEAFSSTLFKATIRVFMSNGDIETVIVKDVEAHNTDTNIGNPSGRIAETTLADLTIKINVGAASNDPGRLSIKRHD